jgi:6-phosphogluconolactonase
MKLNLEFFCRGRDMKKICVMTVAFMMGSVVQAAVLKVYFGTGGNATKGIYHATFDVEKGKLSEAKLVAEIGSPGFLALHPGQMKLYAVGRLKGEAVVAGYHIKPSGDLTQFTASPVRDGGGTHVAVHPSGSFLLTAQYGGGSTALFPLDRDGRLDASVVTEHEGGSKVVAGRQNSPHPHWCGYSPDGRFAFVPDLGMDGVVIYRVDLDGPAISKHGFAASVPGGGPRHMRFSVDGKFIYLLNELSLSVTSFAYDPATGTTTKRSTTPCLSEAVKAKETFNSAAEILVHPNGRFVYSSNRGNDSVTVFRAEPTSARLTVTEVEPVRGAWPRNINMDPSGHWLLTAGAHSNTISVHAIDQDTGELSYQRQGIINVPGPICILFVE